MPRTGTSKITKSQASTTLGSRSSVASAKATPTSAPTTSTPSSEVRAVARSTVKVSTSGPRAGSRVRRSGSLRLGRVRHRPGELHLYLNLVAVDLDLELGLDVLRQVQADSATTAQRELHVPTARERVGQRREPDSRL